MRQLFLLLACVSINLVASPPRIKESAKVASSGLLSAAGVVVHLVESYARKDRSSLDERPSFTELSEDESLYSSRGKKTLDDELDLEFGAPSSSKRPGLVRQRKMDRDRYVEEAPFDRDSSEWDEPPPPGSLSRPVVNLKKEHYLTYESLQTSSKLNYRRLRSMLVKVYGELRQGSGSREVYGSGERVLRINIPHGKSTQKRLRSVARRVRKIIDKHFLIFEG